MLCLCEDDVDLAFSRQLDVWDDATGELDDVDEGRNNRDGKYEDEAAGGGIIDAGTTVFALGRKYILYKKSILMDFDIQFGALLTLPSSEKVSVTAIEINLWSSAIL
ncbi:unnamed protein product [Blepharisma stoltei]|uniref:Uncharacterized protein n=1 Tax=Blepharisma stoltei TaxID=1481888 RepID=A0AAU9I6D0_9CILI|nr:unnamed protein product [Blepharisma stoltei]